MGVEQERGGGNYNDTNLLLRPEVGSWEHGEEESFDADEGEQEGSAEDEGSDLSSNARYLAWRTEERLSRKHSQEKRLRELGLWIIKEQDDASCSGWGQQAHESVDPQREAEDEPPIRREEVRIKTASTLGSLECWSAAEDARAGDNHATNRVSRSFTGSWRLRGIYGIDEHQAVTLQQVWDGTHLIDVVPGGGTGGRRREIDVGLTRFNIFGDHIVDGVDRKDYLWATDNKEAVLWGDFREVAPRVLKAIPTRRLKEGLPREKAGEAEAYLRKKRQKSRRRAGARRKSRAENDREDELDEDGSASQYSDSDYETYFGLLLRFGRQKGTFQLYSRVVGVPGHAPGGSLEPPRGVDDGGNRRYGYMVTARGEPMYRAEDGALIVLKRSALSRPRGPFERERQEALREAEVRRRAASPPTSTSSSDPPSDQPENLSEQSAALQYQACTGDDAGPSARRAAGAAPGASSSDQQHHGGNKTKKKKHRNKVDDVHPKFLTGGAAGEYDPEATSSSFSMQSSVMWQKQSCDPVFRGEIFHASLRAARKMEGTWRDDEDLDEKPESCQGGAEVVGDLFLPGDEDINDVMSSEHPSLECRRENTVEM
eukprot:g18593.t1